ncbi:MAG: DoxX family membrane protein [Gemmatimonadota bacterium]|nr:DoxX family membrane protein [Gemmatimonadota bacterium]
MKAATYIARFLLAFIFIFAGIDKWFVPYDPAEMQVEFAETNPLFYEFYDLLHNAGYLYFVGFFQLLCGSLMVFGRTYLLGGIMFVPLMLCLAMTHVFFSQNWPFLAFDVTMIALVVFLLGQRSGELKATILKPQNRLI